MPIHEAEKNYDFLEIEKDMEIFWNDEAIYSKINSLREKGPKYSFLDGPPYCSGRIHLGTAWNKVIKDTLLRFKSMNGYNLRRQAGWDTHGLPIEHKVEELMNIKTKKEIEEDIGIANFVSKCKEFALKNKDEMTEQFKKMGVWMDWENPYITLDPKYMESCWWTIKRAYEKDLLVNDLRVITWCPRCETALAAAEIDYANKDDPSIYVKFPLEGEENTFVLVWTTTPWTLPANLAICVNPDFDYAYIESDGETYILAEALVDSLFEEYELLKVVKGEELVGKDYIYPLANEVPKQKEFPHKIYPGDHVELEEGTGCVHTAPGHGPEDFEIGKKYSLEIFCPVDELGDFDKDAGKYYGKFVKDADSEIIEDLTANGSIFKEGTVNHRYGGCWRCDTPVIYRATKQWFLKVTDIKEKMLAEIDKVDWVPKWAGESRFHDWVANARDWTISRQRYWGIPIPVWICPDCGKMEVIGSIAELKEKSIGEINSTDEEIVHRPYVDEIEFNCSCGSKMQRIPDVLDVWIDSGVAGWASLYYPNETKLFEEWAPYDFITEGHDQTRGWFYSQLGCGVIALDRAPYERVLMHGFTLDENGKKMSKSLGNVVSPEEVIEKYGADVLRFYLLWATKPWDDLKFNWDEVNNVKKMFNILWNVYVFSSTYMSLDNFNPNEINDYTLRDEDKWILSRANSLAKDVAEDIDKLFYHKATRRINNFILEDLSRWYVRLIRGRTWVEKDDPDKLGAYYSLYQALKILITVMAPITPFITEKIYKNLVLSIDENALESVHMLDWEYDESLIDKDLEAQMDVVREIIEAAARARDIARYKLRWPISELTVVSSNDEVLDAAISLKGVILDQSNTKEVLSDREFKDLNFIAKPNLKTLGPKLRQDMGIVNKFLANADGNEIKSEIEDNSKLIIEEGDKTIELSEGDVLFESELPEDIVSSDFNDGVVFLNTKLSPEIYSEAMARELIRRVQDMRKDLDLDVEAYIDVSVSCSDKFKSYIDKQTDFISNEIRAKSLNFNETDAEFKKDWEIEGEKLSIFINSK